VALRTKASFVKTLVYYDGPQLVALRAEKQHFLAMAIPSEEANRYFVVSTSPKHFQQYLDGEVDLRYLFTYPHQRSTFLATIGDTKSPILLERFDEESPEAYLPERGFFSTDHTEEFRLYDRADDVKRLDLAGQWELQDFGAFQQRYSGVYAFAACLGILRVGRYAADVGASIRSAFLGKPLRGGGSYGSLFSDLQECIPSSDRLRLDKIKKESPGSMQMKGRAALFADAETYIQNYLDHRASIDPRYKELYSLLRDQGLLSLHIREFSERHPLRDSIGQHTATLAHVHLLDEVPLIRELCGGNTLATAKVVLAFHRRVEGAALFFAQGRVEFSQ
jgi:hypothetical protein